MNKFFIILTAVCLLSCQKKETENIPTVEVRKGTITEELTEQGVVHSVHAISINTPRISYRYGGNLKIASIVEDGSTVNEGDTVMVFDPSEVKKGIITAEQQLEVARAEYEKMKATQESEIEDLEADLQISEIDQQIARINFQNAQFESEITKKEIQLKMETATISLNRAREQIENKKKIHKEELYQKELNMNQLQAQLDEANSTLKTLFVVSPSNGLAIVKDNWMTGQKWQVGEQPYAGYPLIDLPDLSQMKTEVQINEVDVSKVKPGLSVEIQSDAYSDTVYRGTISKVANLAQPKDRNSKIKVFPVEIFIEGSESKLLPGLTVRCKIRINEIHDVLYLPVESIFEEYGSPYVYVKTNSGFRRQDIETGAQNTDFVEITKGLTERDLIAVMDPFQNKQEDIR